MSGHSKWATTKHKKAIVDASRGKSFAKLIKNIEVAARMGGGDLSGNPTPGTRHPEGQEVLGPDDNIDRAVKRGSGRDRRGVTTPTIMYEGYGPRGRAAHRVPHRQQEPCRLRGPARALPQRRHARRPRLGGSYLFNRKGVVSCPRTASARTTSSRPRSTQGPRRSTTSATASRSISEPTDLPPSARRSRTPASTTTSAEAEFVPSMQVPRRPRRRREGDLAGRRSPGGPRRRPERLRQRRHSATRCQPRWKPETEPPRRDAAVRPCASSGSTPASPVAAQHQDRRNDTAGHPGHGRRGGDLPTRFCPRLR